MDQPTLDAARRGDRNACGRLLVSLQDVWYRFALAQLHDPDLAADATQETGLRFLRQLPSFRGESQLQTWSLGIVLNVVRELRRRRTSASLSGDDADADELNPPAPFPTDPSAQLENLDDQERVQVALQHLSARQREVLLLRYFEDLSTDQTAAAMNCAPGTVKATLHQALKALKTLLAGGSSGSTKPLPPDSHSPST